MAIFSSLASFFRRHKRKIIISSSVTISIYFLVNQFIIKKFKKFQDSIRQELFIKEQIKRRFIQTQNDCYLTILALLPVLTQPITDHLPIETITQALKLKKTSSSSQQFIHGQPEMSDSLLTANNLLLHSSNNTNNNNNNNNSIDYTLDSIYINKSKVELWNDLKIKTLTRSLTLIYSMCSLLLITRLQLNILARRSYLELAILMAGGELNQSSIETLGSDDYFIEQSYLSLSWWLLNKGWLNFSNIIETIIINHFAKINAKTEISIIEFNQILNNINEEILLNFNNDILQLIFPINYDNLIESLLNTNPELIDELDVKDSNLIKLINETNLLITNNFFIEIFDKMITNSTDTLINNLYLSLDSENYLSFTNLNNNNKSNNKIIELNDIQLNSKKFKLANILAQLSIQCNVICDNNNLADYENNELSGNIFINNLNNLDQLEEFSASIYSNFE